MIPERGKLFEVGAQSALIPAQCRLWSWVKFPQTPYMARVLEHIVQAPKRYIAVLDLVSNGTTSDECLSLTNRLRSELFKTGRFEVLQRVK